MISFLTVVEIGKGAYFNAKKVGEVLIFMASVHHFIGNPDSLMEIHQGACFCLKVSPHMFKHIQTTLISTTDQILIKLVRII